MKRSHKERKREGTERRQRIIERGVEQVLNAWYDSGDPKKLTDAQLADKVFALGELMVRPSENNVSRQRAKWQARHKRQAREQQQQDTAPIPDDIVAMLETEPEEVEEALV